MIQTKAKIVANEKLASNTVKLTMADDSGMAQLIEPGQFVNVRVSNQMDPLFRRPFSVFDSFPSNDRQWMIQVVFSVRGRGTKLLSHLSPGEELDIIGPCGTGFQYDKRKETHVLLGGGLGGAALYLLGRKIINDHQDNAKLEIFLGADSSRSLNLVDAFSSLKSKVWVATDDGSSGYHGFVTDALRHELQTGRLPSDIALYACGPERMLRALIPICQTFHIAAQVTIERRMACGMGVCLSCVCKIKRGGGGVESPGNQAASSVQFEEGSGLGYALTCTDGPVFHLDEVILDE